MACIMGRPVDRTPVFPLLMFFAQQRAGISYREFESACEAYGCAAKCFKGNLNPVADLLQSTPERCAERCAETIRRASGLRFMLSAGCEVPAETRDDTFRAFCESPQRSCNLPNKPAGGDV